LVGKSFSCKEVPIDALSIASDVVAMDVVIVNNYLLIVLIKQM
jgi:hypothetical protein